MFNSSILDVVIGLVFCFASVALFVSSINEAVASFLKLRHKTLLTGIQRMLNDPDGTGLVKTLYEHALVNPLSLAMPSSAAVIDPAAAGAAAPAALQPPRVQVAVEPTTPAWAKVQQLPAYIASKDFAHALIDIIRTPMQPGVQPGADLKADIDKIADPQLRQVLQGFLARAQGDVDKFGDALANWFDSAMDRLSGSYKRRAQFWTFVIGLVTAASLNIDAFYVLDQLWRRPELAAAIVSPASAQLIAAAASSAGSLAHGTAASDGDAAPPPAALSADEVMKTLNTLPVGWGFQRHAPAAMGSRILFYLEWALGVAITGSAAVFGAPFWFDLLQQLIQVRGTGAKPATNRDREKAGTPSRATP
jgi:hypothetical protein